MRRFLNSTKADSASAAMRHVVCLLVALLAVQSVKAQVGSYSITDLGPGAAWAINDSGQVVGMSTANGPWLYSGGVTTYLSPPLAPNGAANFINATGQITGANLGRG